MEKLIALLTEYAHTYADHYDSGEEIVIRFISHNDQCFLYEAAGRYETLVDDVVISKRYGFIKWLLDNNKVDLEELEDDSVLSGIDTRRDYLDMLALLSIQDNPIEFLISLLE